MTEIAITTLNDTPSIRAALNAMLIEAVADGASVTFMHPLPQHEADAFWQKSLTSAARGERMILGAFDGDTLAGTVTLFLDTPQNQKHRAEIAKLITRVAYRKRGIAKKLMQAAERLAIEQGRTLLILDTAEDGGASGLYEKQGFTLAGAIPDYALKPHGGLSPAMFYWKRLSTPVR